MSAKRKYTKRKSKSTASHSLPTGFWSQIGAVCLIAVSLLLVVTWFGAGGPLLEAVHDGVLNVFGYTLFIVPAVFLYVALEIFRAEDNQLPMAVKIATGMMLLWFCGLFGLGEDSIGKSTGGIVGDVINKLMLVLVDPGVAGFIYILLIFITGLFLLRVSPFSIWQKMRELVSSSTSKEDKKNKEALKTINKSDDKVISSVKLNQGVPTLDSSASKSSSDDGNKLTSFGRLTGATPQDKAAEDQLALVSISDPDWKAPSLSLLEKKQSPADAGNVQQNAQIIHDTLRDFSIDVEMEDANIGPKVTQYTLKPPSGVKLAKISSLENNIALNLAASNIRIEAPIPGKRAVGIEVPNVKAADVRLSGILTSDSWKGTDEPLSFAIGKDISGEAVVGELNKMPHLLIAGQTGSGKSVMINALLSSLLYRNGPSEMKLILVDPKQVEMAPYEDIPHLLTPVINQPEKTISALRWAVNEMERRYKLLAAEKLRDIKGYNKRIKSKAKKIAVEDENGNVQQHEDGTMPYIVIVIDELADLMMVAARDVEALVVRLAQKARAVGIHLVLATQRPSVDVITGLIKANVPARIAFTVASQVDSRTIIDKAGAEKLLGQGDMLMTTPSAPKPRRIQGAWVTDSEVVKIADYLRMQSAPQYNDEIVAQPVQLNGRGGIIMSGNDSADVSSDPTYQEAMRVVVESQKASISLLQRRLGIGYNKAARYIDNMEERGVVGPSPGSNKQRAVLITSLEETDGLD